MYETNNIHFLIGRLTIKTTRNTPLQYSHGNLNKENKTDIEFSIDYSKRNANKYNIRIF